MRFTLLAAATLVIAPALTGCSTPVTTGPVEHVPRALVVAEAQSDVGNDRPESSYDGLMVRRRTVLALGLNRYDALAAMAKHLQSVALRSGTTVTKVPPSVLDPLPLEQFEPDLVMALPAAATLADGGRLLSRVLRPTRWSDMTKTKAVLSVLVHDLSFTVDSSHPAVLARAIAREGIVSDALGNYLVVLGSGKLHILYTGPLLSDGLVRAVRAGIARRADVRPAAVTVGPRTRAGVGVDLAQEPTPAPEGFSAPPDHEHH